MSPQGNTPPTHQDSGDGALRLHTIAETAELLRISRTSCYKLVYSGEIAVHRVGGSLRVSHQDLLSYLSSAASWTTTSTNFPLLTDA